MSDPKPEKQPPKYTAQQSRRYARLLGRPLDVLIRTAIMAKLTDAELGALARVYAKIVMERAAAGDLTPPFLDSCMTRALAEITKANPQ